MKNMNGVVALLTGGSRGIGPVIAEAVAQRGATIILAARSESKLNTVASRLKEMGATVFVMPTDLRDSSQREKLIADVVKYFGKLDVLINNAGLETEGAYTELPWKSIRETVEVNLVAPMALTHLILPHMIERNSGHIINIASIAAKSGAPYAAVYSGTKAGLAEWTRALRLELHNTNIRFSTIFPGYIREVGMFAKFQIQAPWIIGSSTACQVAEAVVQAIEKGGAERIINGMPLRYSFAINEISPSVGDWLMRISGLVDFQRRKVDKKDIGKGDRDENI